MGPLPYVPWRVIGEWIYYFQTLITGIVAVFAAGITVYFLQKQIKQSAEHRKDTIRRQNVSARVGMIKALSEICEYSRLSIDYVNEIFSLWSKDHRANPFEPNNSCPVYPQEALDKVQLVVDGASSSDAKIIGEFVSLAQIQNVRMKKILSDLNDNKWFTMREVNFHEHLFDAIGLLKFSQRFFEYGRLQSDTIEDICTADEACTSLFHLNIDNEELNLMIHRRWPPELGG